MQLAEFHAINVLTTENCIAQRQLVGFLFDLSQALDIDRAVQTSQQLGSAETFVRPSYLTTFTQLLTQASLTAPKLTARLVERPTQHLGRDVRFVGFVGHTKGSGCHLNRPRMPQDQLLCQSNGLS